MCHFCHAQLFEITRANKIKSPLVQHSCQNAKVVHTFEPNTPFEKLPGTQITYFPIALTYFPIAPAALSVPCLPRLRALALFGRRPSERGDSLGMPASENLHTNGLMHCNRQNYSITSSAMASSEGAIGRPSALAVLRLMTRSNFVDCSTGRSAGFAPCRILSVYSAARLYIFEKFTP